MTTGVHSLIRDPSAQQITLTSNQGEGDYGMAEVSGVRAKNDVRDMSPS